MTVTVRTPEALRRYAPPEVEVPPGTARDVLARVFLHHPALESRCIDAEGRVHPYLLLFLGDEPANLATQAGNGDVLEIVAAAEGG